MGSSSPLVGVEWIGEFWQVGKERIAPREDVLFVLLAIIERCSAQRVGAFAQALQKLWRSGEDVTVARSIIPPNHIAGDRNPTVIPEKLAVLKLPRARRVAALGPIGEWLAHLAHSPTCTSHSSKYPAIAMVTSLTNGLTGRVSTVARAGVPVRRKQPSSRAISGSV